jgi:hypothetical protein
MMMRLFAAFLLMVGGFLSTGCGTMFTGTKSTVTIDSTPAGADFLVRPSGRTGTTPGSVRLPSNKEYTVDFEKACYLPTQTYIEKSIQPMTFLNALWVWSPLIMIVGFGVDFASGGMHSLDDTHALLREDPNACVEE